MTNTRLLILSLISYAKKLKFFGTIKWKYKCVTCVSFCDSNQRQNRVFILNIFEKFLKLQRNHYDLSTFLSQNNLICYAFGHFYFDINTKKYESNIKCEFIIMQRGKSRSVVSFARKRLLLTRQGRQRFPKIIKRSSTPANRPLIYILYRVYYPFFFFWIFFARSWRNL